MTVKLNDKLQLCLDEDGQRFEVVPETCQVCPYLQDCEYFD